MASGFYVTGLKELLDGTLDIDNDTFKLMLVQSGYTYDPDHDVVDNGANDATDPSFNEVSATNYTGGWGGSGRKTATISVSADKTNNRVVCSVDDLTWSSIGGASNDTIAGVLLIKEGGANDTTSRLIGYLDINNTPTNGGDITLDFLTSGSGGNLRLNLV